MRKTGWIGWSALAVAGAMALGACDKKEAPAETPKAAAPAQDAASSNVMFTYSPAPGSTFPLGLTPRIATGTDEAGNSSVCTTYVLVQDTTPPAVTCSADLTAEATGPEGAAVTYVAPTATDAVTTAPALSASHASGSRFPLGTTAVTITARDAAGNMGTCSFSVTVVEPPPPPAITLI